MHDAVTESQDTTELCDVYLVGSELCGVCCVLWCVGSGFQVQGLGSGNVDPMRATRHLASSAFLCLTSLAASRCSIRSARRAGYAARRSTCALYWAMQSTEFMITDRC
jgi:hypothetical protein